VNITLDIKTITSYKSNSQKARLFTETWVEQNIYCLSCGNEQLNKFCNNKPVADFYCKLCSAEYELKSKQDTFPKKIVDGAYSSMVNRITSNNNPSFFFLGYSYTTLEVRNFLVIPKHFFTTDIIEKRKPLSNTAKRAGWIGCNILLHKIPAIGKLYLIHDGKIEDKKNILNRWSRASFLANQNVQKRGWIIETMNIIDKLGHQFTLKDVYAFENFLKSVYPNNHFIKDKLRQQLQVLRDKNLIEFLGQGMYRKVE
jgi:type II restriction enzyme